MHAVDSNRRLCYNGCNGWGQHNAGRIGMARRQVLVAGVGVALLALGVGGGMAVRATVSPAALYTITVGRNPGAVAVDAPAGRVFVANFSDSSVSVLDTSSGRVLRTVAVAGQPALVVVVSRSHRAPVVPAPLQFFPNNITVLDSRTGAVLGTVPRTSDASAVAVDQRSGHAFVIDGSADSLRMLDLASRRVVRTAPVGPDPRRGYDPQAVAADQRTGHVFVVNAATPSLSLFDAHTAARLRTISLGPPCQGCEIATDEYVAAVDEHTARLFVTNGSRGSVSVFDTATGSLLRTVPVGAYPSGVAVDSRARHVFVSGTGLSMLDARSGRGRRTIAASGGLLAVDERTSRLFVVGAGATRTVTAWGWVPSWLQRAVPLIPPPRPTTTSLAGSVRVFDTRTGVLLRTVPVGVNPSAVVVDDRTGRAFVLTVGPVAASGPAGRGIVSVLDAAR